MLRKDNISPIVDAYKSMNEWENSEFSQAVDIVRKHSPHSEISSGGSDGTKVTSELKNHLSASPKERDDHHNMLKDKLKHLKSVKVVKKDRTGYAV